MRRITFVLLPALATIFAGCLLLPEDPQAPRSALDLRVIARESDLAKSPCGDPVALLSQPTEDLSAVARVYRGKGREQGELIASADLAIGEYDATDASREMTGLLDLPLGPAGFEWRIEVELYYHGLAGRDPIGDYVGQMRLDSGLLINTGLSVGPGPTSGVHSGQVAVSFGNLQGGASVDPVLYDVELNLMEFGYVSEPIEWNDDPSDLRVIEVSFAAGFGPSLIFSANRDLPDLVPGPIAVELPTIELVPIPNAPLAAELLGTIDVQFTDGRAPRERGTVALTRIFDGCD